MSSDVQQQTDVQPSSDTEYVRIERDRLIDIKGSMQELAAASEQIAQSTDEVNGVADQQADNMTQVAGEAAELSATVEEIASSSDQVRAESRKARELAEASQNAADGAIEAMELVDHAATEVATDISALRDRVDDIDEVVAVIRDIADQTNLLALNANIEAARAEDGGDGFAVVADEIKSLAEETQDQTADIEQMADQIKSNTSETFDSIGQANTRIDDGIEKVESALDSLNEITRAVSEINDGIEEVADATDEQAASTEEVAAMADDANDRARMMADEIDELAAANQQQTAKVTEIADILENFGENRRTEITAGD